MNEETEPTRYEPPKLVKPKPLHVMILGQSTSGKSVLGKTFAQAYLDKGVGVLVYDPLNDSDWPCHFKTDNIEEFLEVFAETEEAALFVDEAWEVFGVGQKQNHIIATRGRHQMCRLHMMSQRSYSAIAPIVRDQCSDLFAFNLALKDAEELAKDWNDKSIQRIADFVPGQYLHKRRMKPANEYRLFDVEM